MWVNVCACACVHKYSCGWVCVSLPVINYGRHIPQKKFVPVPTEAIVTFSKSFYQILFHGYLHEAILW